MQQPNPRHIFALCVICCRRALTQHPPPSDESGLRFVLWFSELCRGIRGDQTNCQLSSLTPCIVAVSTARSHKTARQRFNPFKNFLSVGNTVKFSVTTDVFDTGRNTLVVYAQCFCSFHRSSQPLCQKYEII